LQYIILQTIIKRRKSDSSRCNNYYYNYKYNYNTYSTMKTFALGPILSVAAVAALAVRCIDASDALRVDGGEELGWDEDRWFVQVDGVMGGKSSGEMEFFPSDDTANNNNNNAMRFTGDISLDGGGFSSVRRQIDLDLSEYAGIVITLEADARSIGQEAIPPTGLHLQLGDSTSYYDFSSAFAIPLSSSNGNDPVVTSVYLPIESFDRGTSFGFECRGNCNFNPSNIDNMSVYVLFQEGSFDVRLRSIVAVGEPRSFPPPTYDALESSDDIVSLLRSTISSGGGLYDLSYVELCIAMYWSVLNTILASAVSLSDPLKVVICAGLEEVEYQMDDGDSKANIAWTLRHAMDAVIADLRGSSRTTVQDWLPTASEAASMEVVCEGRTSAAMGLRYDPTNESILDIDFDDERSNSTSASEAEDDLIEEQSALSGGVAVVSGHGYRSVVAGILLLGVIQMV